jgi:hypothetical protein
VLQGQAEDPFFFVTVRQSKDWQHTPMLDHQQDSLWQSRKRKQTKRRQIDEN